MLAQMYTFAKEGNYDIVWSDWFLTYSDRERYMRQPEYITPFEALKGMLGGVMKFNVWNKLVRRSLYTKNRIMFPTGYGMGEDMTIMRLFARSKRVAYLSKAFYHYVQQNAEAFSKTYSKRHLRELQHNVSIIEDDMHHLYGKQLERELAFLKLDVKFPFLMSSDAEKYTLWETWYPEANQFILQNRNLSFRRRCLQWCAWKGQWWVLRFYDRFITNGLYRILYH